MDAKELLDQIVRQCGLGATLYLLERVANEQAIVRLNTDEFPNRASVWRQSAQRLERVARFACDSGI